MFLSVILTILESKKDSLKGKVELSRGKTIEINEQGIAELRTLLNEAMSKPKEEQQPTPQIPWWSPFTPQIQSFLDKLIELMDWYPKAIGKGKRDITFFFGGFLILIVLTMAVLTLYDKISGETFAFVVGALIGYIFAFLTKYLGLVG
jgi:hypothetical protein